jgi:flagellar motor switch protein FliG
MPAGAMVANELSGREKAAILLIALGPEKSAQVFKHLKEEEIEQLTLEIANTTTVMPETKEAVLDEFYQICLAQEYITEGGIAYAKNILEKALGESKAFEVLSKLTVSLQVRPFDFIRKTEATQITNFIQNEHPQTIALILSYLRPKQAAEVLADLMPEKQADVARRIAIMEGTSPDVIKEVEKVFEKRISALVMEDYTNVGGVDSVVEILNAVDRTTEKRIMETLEVEDIELSEEIRRKMFVFEDILSLGNRDVQQVLKEVDQKELSIALKGSTEELRQHIFANLSKRLAAMIQEDMDYMGPIRRSDMEEAQQKIVNIVRRLQDAGEIIVARGGGDDVIL